MCKHQPYTDILDRAVYEKTFRLIWCFWSSHDRLFPGKPSDPQIPANNWTGALYADTHTYTHSNKKTTTMNQQV